MYVLGTRAGRERYLQITEFWTKIGGDKQVSDLMEKTMGIISAPRDQVTKIIGNGLRDGQRGRRPRPCRRPGPAAN